MTPSFPEAIAINGALSASSGRQFRGPRHNAGNQSQLVLGGIPVAKLKKTETKVTLDQRAPKERRGTERRQKEAPVAIERRTSERREKVNRRRQIDPTTCERDYTDEEVEFLHALDSYKRTSGRMFPTCSEVLEVLRGLGYEKRCGAAAGAIAESLVGSS